MVLLMLGPATPPLEISSRAIRIDEIFKLLNLLSDSNGILFYELNQEAYFFPALTQLGYPNEMH